MHPNTITVVPTSCKNIALNEINPKNSEKIINKNINDNTTISKPISKSNGSFGLNNNGNQKNINNLDQVNGSSVNITNNKNKNIVHANYEKRKKWKASDAIKRSSGLFDDSSEEDEEDSSKSTSNVDNVYGHGDEDSQKTGDNISPTDLYSKNAIPSTDLSSIKENINSAVAKGIIHYTDQNGNKRRKYKKEVQHSEFKNGYFGINFIQKVY